MTVAFSPPVVRVAGPYVTEIAHYRNVLVSARHGVDFVDPLLSDISVFGSDIVLAWYGIGGKGLTRRNVHEDPF